MDIHSRTGGKEEFSLPTPARYFPVDGGPYQVTAGLKNLGTDFGNGPADARLAQLDTQFDRYRSNKQACRLERLGKYFATQDFSDEVQAACAETLVRALCREYPDYFSWSETGDASGVLNCKLTREKLAFDAYALVPKRSITNASVPYTGAFDALVCQIQEDVAVVRRNEARDWLSAVHLCAAGHWAPEDKVGRDFTGVHQPVPHIEPITRAARAMVHAMIQKGPFVRFVWGFGSDDRLNHHPQPAPGWDAAAWKGRSFRQDAGADASPFYLRLERQVTYGLPHVQAALFFIRVYYIDGREIRANKEERDRLLVQLKTMDVEIRRYKGLAESMQPLVQWLESEA